MPSLNFWSRSRSASLVVPAVTATVLPARSRNELIGDPHLTITLVPATKMTGEKATRFCRSTLLVVEHSRSTRPVTTASMRESAVTGTHWMSTVLSMASSMDDTSALHSSME